MRALKRIKAACICQTLHFQLKEDLDHASAVNLVKEEVANYKSSLIRKHTLHKIVEETVQPDGSIIVKVKKQYNNCDAGDYLD
ncbi:MAG: hypothetical protein ACI3VB_08840 [Oscillospiraceae bacterium]